jgi:hypothetical protein
MKERKRNNKREKKKGLFEGELLKINHLTNNTNSTMRI